MVRPGDPAASEEVGWELDFTTTIKPGKHHAILVGYSHFFPGGFLRDTGLSSGTDFFYTQYSFAF